MIGWMIGLQILIFYIYSYVSLLEGNTPNHSPIIL